MAHKRNVVVGVVVGFGVWMGVSFPAHATNGEGGVGHASTPVQGEYMCDAAATTNDPTVCVNVNTASTEALIALPGVGVVLAQRIIDARPLADTAALDAVKGFGVKTLAKVAPYVYFGQ